MSIVARLAKVTGLLSSAGQATNQGFHGPLFFSLKSAYNTLKPAKACFQSRLIFNHMDKAILDQIREKLEARKSELETELSTIANQEGIATFEDIEDDEDVNAQEVSQYSDRLSLAAELKKHLDDVNKSLKKIDEGSYGICKYCKKEINPQRLLARPASGSCVECKATLQGELRP